MEKKYTNSKNKKVSACFLDNKAFKALIDGKNDEDLIKIASAIETTANEAIDNANETIAKARRAIAKLEKMDGTQMLIEANENTIDKNQETIDSLKKDKAWWKTMIKTIALQFGEE